MKISLPHYLGLAGTFFGFGVFSGYAIWSDHRTSTEIRSPDAERVNISASGPAIPSVHSKVTNVEINPSAAPLIAPEILDQVRFEKFKDGRVTELARKVLQLTAQDCEEIEIWMQERNSQRTDLEKSRERQATLTEPEAGADFTWEIALPSESIREIEATFHANVRAAIGEEKAEKLLGSSPITHPDGRRKRRLLSILSNGRYEDLIFTDIDGERYDSTMRSAPLEGLSLPDKVWAAIKRDLK